MEINPYSRDSQLYKICGMIVSSGSMGSGYRVGGCELVTLVGVCRLVHILIPHKRFVLVDKRILGYVKP